MPHPWPAPGRRLRIAVGVLVAIATAAGGVSITYGTVGPSSGAAPARVVVDLALPPPPRESADLPPNPEPVVLRGSAPAPAAPAPSDTAPSDTAPASAAGAASPSATSTPPHSTASVSTPAPAGSAAASATASPGADVGVTHAAPPVPQPPAEVVTVSRGDSLYTIFKARALSQGDLARILAASPEAKDLARLAPGQRLEIRADPDGSIRELVHRIDASHELRITRRGDGFASEVVVTPLEHRVATAAGTIRDSLFLAGQRAGLSDRLIMKMVAIFGWDIDFALDIRPGDRFDVIYEELFRDGKKVHDGEILTAEFVNDGKTTRAVRYVDPTGRAEYYTPDGHNMRKEFLRTPVKFTRISSRFSRARMHPILHRMRAHHGVDYAAPIGTPVKASGDGKVEFAGRKGGYGNVVMLRHGAVYTTVYGHLSRFAKGLHAGERVRQGQVIGYVGMTGLATGPHLHYEFRVNGVHHDPLTVKLPKAAPIAAAYRRDFLAKTAPLVARLDTLAHTEVASRE